MDEWEKKECRDAWNRGIGPHAVILIVSGTAYLVLGVIGCFV